MLPEPLVYVFTAVGVACLGNLFLLSREYKDKSKTYTQNETTKLLLSQSTKDFVKNLRAKKVTLEMVSDFYDDFADASNPERFFRRTWNRFLIAGILFIVSAIIGCIDWYGAELIIILYPAGFAVIFLVWALGNLYLLDKTLP